MTPVSGDFATIIGVLTTLWNIVVFLVYKPMEAVS